mmetsp:Transcript_14833/g.64193  ORF Transcript_14833/g.64193 Transcript_14833/m.64193 type:complete len:244 (-) Transcript_14833:456-1187(-)
MRRLDKNASAGCRRLSEGVHKPLRVPHQLEHHLPRPHLLLLPVLALGPELRHHHVVQIVAREPRGALLHQLEPPGPGLVLQVQPPQAGVLLEDAPVAPRQRLQAIHHGHPTEEVLAHASHGETDARVAGRQPGVNEHHRGAVFVCQLGRGRNLLERRGIGRGKHENLVTVLVQQAVVSGCDRERRVGPPRLEHRRASRVGEHRLDLGVRTHALAQLRGVLAGDLPNLELVASLGHDVAGDGIP